MTSLTAQAPPAPATPPAARASPAEAMPQAARYAVTAMMVALATLIGEAVQAWVGAPNVTLVYVLPVVVAASAFGLGPAVAAIVLGVIAFDFFFTQPYLSLTIDKPADLWAAVLLMVIAALVSAVAAEARRGKLEARLAAVQAEAVQTLAKSIVDERPQPQVLQTAVEALQAMFGGPAVVLLSDGGRLDVKAGAGDPRLGPGEDEAARWALSAGLHTQANSYPFDESRFDFWPVGPAERRRAVLGVDFTRAREGRPEAATRLVEMVAGYVAVALTR